MSITTKSTIALAGMFLALLLGAWLTLELAVRPGFVREEEAAHARDVARLQQNLDLAQREVRSRALDYARWDDTYAYVSGRNPGYIPENFQDEWFANYGADFIAFADTEGRLLWTRSIRPQSTPQTDPALGHRVLDRARRVVSAGAAPASGVVWTADGPLLFGIARATRNDGSGPARGFVIIGRRLDSAALHQQLQLDLSFISAASAPRDLDARLAALNSAATAKWRTNDAHFALIALRNGDHLVGAIMARQDRRLSALGANAIVSALAIFAVFFGVVAALSWLTMSRIVTARLARIKHHFQNQGGQAQELPHDASNDEIGQLTAAYNDLLHHLRSAMESEQQALRETQVAHAENRVKSDFLANISHELRTPLNAVVGYAELIAEDLAEQGVVTGRADLAHITSASRHLLTLINEILDLSRLESDRLELRPESFRVDEMLKNVLHAGAPLAAAQGNTLRLDCEEDLGAAYSDHVRLRQCLVNVLAHACKRTHASVLRLRAERRESADGDTLRFEIHDGGPLLTPAQMEALFEPFVRVEDIPGAGARLGLAVTRKLLTMMGGRIEILNKLGRGCIFVVTTPAQIMDATSTNQAAA